MCNDIDMPLKVFITGGTGSLGSRIVSYILTHFDNILVHPIIFSRDEQKQYQMRLKCDSKITTIIGDVRDYTSVYDAIYAHKPHIVIHTAAQKHVRVCAESPEQTVLTNINGTMNVGKAALQNNVDVACFVSTDKAVDPTTIYGMSKAIAEQIWINYSGIDKIKTSFVGVRYGNVLDSAGSLIPLYCDIMAKATEKSKRFFPLTGEEMTRFFITFNQAISLIFQTVRGCSNKFEDVLDSPTTKSIVIHGHDKIFTIPELPAAKIKHIAEIFAEHSGGTIRHILPYPSEKSHEVLMDGYSSEHCTISKEEVFKILVKNIPNTFGIHPSVLREKK